jgi:hypothetical protein
MPTIRWSNGQEDKAATWDDLLDRVRRTQWHTMTEDEFRAVLAVRALRWSKTEIDPTLPAQDLFYALEQAHLIEIITDHHPDNC